MTTEEIERTYKLIKELHNEHLAPLGVRLPKLKTNNQYTKDALTLVFLAQGYPNTKIVDKGSLTSFIRKFHPTTTDVQQARHLGAQKGWYILAGTRGDNIPKDCYQLLTLEDIYPGSTLGRRKSLISTKSFDKLKEEYGSRCATCGSKEGEPHFHWGKTTTQLQKGHMDPSKPLEAGNIIPQCSVCNQASKNLWVYDEKGRVIAVANEKAIDKCSDELKEKIYLRLQKQLKKKS